MSFDAAKGSKAVLSIKRKPVNLDHPVVKEEFFQNGCFPLIIRPAAEDLDPCAWARSNRAFIEGRLDKYGAILFRGFKIRSAAEFRNFAEMASDNLLDYKERSSPRSEVAQQIYTSTDYPASQHIFLHNEHSYAQVFPLRLFFFCETPAEIGGQTPIADCRRIYQRISPEIRREFMTNKWMYVRNFGDGFGLTWQTAFQSDNRSVVEEYCKSSDMQFEWRDGNRLRTRQVREAVVRHPRTGSLVWFNHATFFHISTLPSLIREGLMKEFAEEDLPNNTYYGDGSSIPQATMETLRQAYLDEMVSFDWQQGDVMLLDNMLAAHSRAPYKGQRRVLVAMAEPTDRSSIQIDPAEILRI